MNIKQLDSHRILISFGDRELDEKYHTSYEKLNSGNIREFLKTSLSHAGNGADIALSGSPLQIEAAKYESGCIFLITICAQKRRFYISERSDSYAFIFRGLEELTGCVRVMNSEGLDTRGSCIYYSPEDHCGRYYLILKRVFRKSRVFGIACEYGRCVCRGRFIAAAIGEKSLLIACGNAVRRLGAIS